MSNTPKLENYYNKFLQDIIFKTFEQNKVAETYLVQKDFSNALKELLNINEKLEEYCKVFSLLEMIRTHFSEDSEKGEIYN